MLEEDSAVIGPAVASISATMPALEDDSVRTSAGRFSLDDVEVREMYGPEGAGNALGANDTTDGCENAAAVASIPARMGGREITGFSERGALVVATMPVVAVPMVDDGFSMSFLCGEEGLDIGGEGYDSVICQDRVRPLS